MISDQLFNSAQAQRPVRVGVMGPGQDATAVVSQSVGTARLEVPAVADADPDAAWQAYRYAGLGGEAVENCQSRSQALEAMERGKCIIVEDGLVLPELPLDVIVESTGAQEAGARHAVAAIRQDKQVVMVNKETDCISGPVLKHLADEAGVVYKVADGDQPSLLLVLLGWAKELGLEVLCAGKAAEHHLIVDPAAVSAGHAGRTFPLEEKDALALRPLAPGQEREATRQRAGVITGPSHMAGLLALIFRKPSGSTLWSLRAQQDWLFHPAPGEVDRL